MIAVLGLKTIAEISAVRIVDCLVEGTVVAACGALLFRILRRHGSSARFGVLFSALVGVAVLPLFSGAWTPGGPGIAGHAMLGRAAAIVVPDSWAFYLFGAWALIAGFALLRVAVGLVQLCRLRRSCRAVDIATLDRFVCETLRHSCPRSGVQLCTSNRVQSPTAIGFFKPAVVIPEWSLKELSPTELNQVLLHELAHLRRWDDWTNLVQKIVKAVWFFHPAVWWIERRISLEREMACDDVVLAQTENPRSYAECLAVLAEKSLVRRGMALAQAAVGKLRHTSLRVARILDHGRQTRKLSAWKPVTMLSTGLAGLCVVFVVASPKLIAFQRVVVPTIRSNAGVPTLASLSIAPQNAAESLRMKAPANQAALIVPASLKTHVTTQPRARATQLVFRTKRNQDPQPILAQARKLNPESLVHLAKARAIQPVVTEAVFVFVENAPPGSLEQASYEISVWRVILVRSVNAPITPATPRKEI